MQGPEVTLSAHVSLRRVGRFVWDNLLYILLAPTVALAVTLLHEGAHAVAILLQGGEVTRFEIFPHGDALGAFGRTAYAGTGDELRWLIAMAPALVGTVLALWTATLTLFLRPGSRFMRLLLLFGFFGPLLDASIGAAGLFGHVPRTDWYTALHGRELSMSVAFGAYVAIFSEIGLAVFRRAWGKALSATEYTFGLLALLAAPWVMLLAPRG